MGLLRINRLERGRIFGRIVRRRKEWGAREELVNALNPQRITWINVSAREPGLLAIEPSFEVQDHVVAGRDARGRRSAGTQKPRMKLGSKGKGCSELICRNNLDGFRHQAAVEWPVEWGNPILLPLVSHLLRLGDWNRFQSTNGSRLLQGNVLRRCCVLNAVRPPMGQSHCCRRVCLHMIPMNPSCFISGVCSADLSLDMGLVDQGVRPRRRAAAAELVQGRPW
ncbi:hypothetical protein SAMN02744784_01197 [Stenotrophomonas sp. CC120223-11]|nr:hypothetical protein SAMN02744784_01197 [Stenotrophomonas sp. CC120223-11]